MALELVKLYKGDGTFIKDAAISEGLFSTTVDQGTGSCSIKGKSKDDTGNLSAYSPVKNYYAGSSATPVCDLLDDTGESSSDNLTNDDTPRIKVNITLPLPSGSSEVHLCSVQKLELWHKIGAGTLTKIADLTSITRINSTQFSATYQFSSAIAEGDHYFKAKWIDSQDGVSAYGSELHIIVDKTAPNVPSIEINDGTVYIGQSVEVSGEATE